MKDTLPTLDRIVWRAGDIQFGCSPRILAPARHLDTVERIERLMSMYAMPYDAVVWRAFETVGDLASGDVLREPLYLCGSLDITVAGSAGIPVGIAVPEGTPCVPLGWLSDEALPEEVLLGRGTAFRIDRVEQTVVRATWVADR